MIEDVDFCGDVQRGAHFAEHVVLGLACDFSVSKWRGGMNRNVTRNGDGAGEWIRESLGMAMVLMHPPRPRPKTRKGKWEMNIQSVPSISNTIPLNCCAPSSLPPVEFVPRGAKRRFPCVEEAMPRTVKEPPKTFVFLPRFPFPATSLAAR